MFLFYLSPIFLFRKYCDILLKMLQKNFIQVSRNMRTITEGKTANKYKTNY